MDEQKKTENPITTILCVLFVIGGVANIFTGNVLPAQGASAGESLGYLCATVVLPIVCLVHLIRSKKS